ncbi:MAG: RNA 2'-phosphotransferase [Archaeoglobaceae archaeon]
MSDLGVCERCGPFEGTCECGRGRIVLKAEKRIAVSKFLSGLLRHFPDSFGLKLDEDGWADLEEVAKIVEARHGVGKFEIELIAAFDGKGRFEIRNGRIRARYGHSVRVRKDWSEGGKIPDKLYHATCPQNVESIMRLGLLPMRRLEVHMCETPEEALEVGRRHCRDPVLLEIDAKRVLESGIEIRKKGRVYTADAIPPQFIRVV